MTFVVDGAIAESMSLRLGSSLQSRVLDIDSHLGTCKEFESTKGNDVGKFAMISSSVYMSTSSLMFSCHICKKFQLRQWKLPNL